jgi:hypothetical protein
MWTLQNLVVAMIVAACFAYAGWSLMPRAWRPPLAAALRRLPGLGRWSALQPGAQGGGACSGCDSACQPVPPQDAPKPVKFYRRLP